MFNDGKFRNFFSFERAGVVEDFAVAIAEDIRGEPTVESEGARSQPWRDDRFHKGLARFEVFSHDGDFFAQSQLYESGSVDGEIGGAVGVGDAASDRGVGVDHAWGDARIVFFESFFERLDGFVAIFARRVAFGRAAPEHDESIAAVIGFEFCDVVFDELGEIPFGGGSFGVSNFEIVAESVIEDGVHGLNGFEFFADGIEVFVFEDARTFANFVSIFAMDIPRAKDDIGEIGQRYEILDQRIAVFSALAQADAPHLSDGADGETITDQHIINAGDQRRRDGAKTRNEDTKFASSRFHIYRHHIASIRKKRRHDGDWNIAFDRLFSAVRKAEA